MGIYQPCKIKILIPRNNSNSKEPIINEGKTRVPVISFAPPPVWVRWLSVARSVHSTHHTDPRPPGRSKKIRKKPRNIMVRRNITLYPLRLDLIFADSFGLFLLLDSDTDSNSNLHCKPNGYTVTCGTFHIAPIPIPILIPPVQYRNSIAIGIGIPICECK